MLNSVTELHLLIETFELKASEEEGRQDLATNLSEMKVVDLVVSASLVCVFLAGLAASCRR